MSAFNFTDFDKKKRHPKWTPRGTRQKEQVYKG